MRRYVHKLDRAVPTLYEYIGKNFRIKSSRYYCIKRIVSLNLPSSIIAQIELSMLDVFFNEEIIINVIDVIQSTFFEIFSFLLTLKFDSFLILSKKAG